MGILFYTYRYKDVKVFPILNSFIKFESKINNTDEIKNAIKWTPNSFGHYKL
jgi:hypothetical protein